MVPILIDNRDMLKLIFASVMVTLVVFASGFFIGLHRADAFSQAGVVVQSLVLPQHVEAGDISGPQLPARVEAGENIDVDQPDRVLLSDTEGPDAASDSFEQLASLPDDNPISPDTTRVSEQDIVARQPEVSAEIIPETPSTEVELSKIKYTIQAGVYGSLHNAENMVKMLQAQKYEAYISDYLNGKNETRYNVRFGYFSDRKSAMSSLAKFKRNRNSDGYLVRFSAENIVNIVSAVDDPGAATPVQNDGFENYSMPVVNTPESTTDNISQADVLQNADVASN